MKTLVKYSIWLFFILTTISLSSQENSPKVWELDKDHTSVNFGVKHFFNTVNGIFQEKEGTFVFDKNNLSDSKFTFKIPVSSIDTNNEKRDKHLKSADFFEAEKYPFIIFSSTKIEQVTGNDYKVTGDLKIKNVTKSISVPFQITGEMESPMMKGTLILGMAFKTTINRTDYNVGVGNWAATMVVGKEVNVDINMELNSKI